MYLNPRGISRRQVVEHHGRPLIPGEVFNDGIVVLRLDREGSLQTLSVATEPFEAEEPANTSFWVVPRTSLSPMLTGMTDPEFDQLLADL